MREMRKSLANEYDLSVWVLCPFCEFLCSEDEVREHMIKKHTDEEMIEHTGWDLEDFEEDK